MRFRALNTSENVRKYREVEEEKEEEESDQDRKYNKMEKKWEFQ